MTAFPFLRLAAIGMMMMMLALGLTACGRRGGLDLPPRSASQNSDQQAQSEAGLDEYGNPLPPRGQKKSFPLDVILN